MATASRPAPQAPAELAASGPPAVVPPPPPGSNRRARAARRWRRRRARHRARRPRTPACIRPAHRFEAPVHAATNNSGLPSPGAALVESPWFGIIYPGASHPGSAGTCAELSAKQLRMPHRLNVYSSTILNNSILPSFSIALRIRKRPAFCLERAPANLQHCQSVIVCPTSV